MADRTARNKRRIAKGLPKKEHNGARTYNACLDAISAVMRKAVDDELIQVNPVSAIKRKRYTRSECHGLSQEQMEQIFESALNGGNDPILDFLILWTLTETACRTGGLIKLQLGDISKERQTITLYEKGGTKREQPVTAELMNSLLELIVVIIVLGILAALAVPTLSTVKEKSADSIALKNAQALQGEFDAMLSIDPTTQPDKSVVGQGQYGSWTINGYTYVYKADEANKLPAIGTNVFKH